MSLSCGQVLASGTAPKGAGGFTTLKLSNDADYSRLISAIRAAEYIRSDVIAAENPKPRVYAALAGVMAYAERNPNASRAQVSAYLEALDVALQAHNPNDPDLIDRGVLFGALRFAVVQDPMFHGTDTLVGERALNLLGITIPDPDGFESLESRMVTFEISLARSLDYRNEVFDLLVAGFFGVDPSGNEWPTMPAALHSYFLSESFDPALGSERLDLVEVNEGLASLPADYAAYQRLISDFNDPENTGLRGQLDVQFETVRARIQTTVQSLATLDRPLTESIDNPAVVTLALEELRQTLRATARARATASAATYLMLQSNALDIDAYAFAARDYSQISLEVNESAAIMASAGRIGASLILAYQTRKLADPTIALGQLANAAKDTYLLIAGLDAPPTVEEQTFNQIVELRQQVEDLRIEMSTRFNRIESQLNNLFLKVTDGFDAIGMKLDDLSGDVQSISSSMMLARSQLRRLEYSLYGIGQEFLQQLFSVEANAVLNYRDRNGLDLPYVETGTNFVDGENSFFTYVTTQAESSLFVGPRATPQEMLDDAEAVLGIDEPISGFLNDLSELPTALSLSPLLVAPTKLPGIEPWSQSAAAYAQLMRENPWFFRFQYGQQVESFNSGATTSPPRLDTLISSGERLTSFVEAIRQTNAEGASPLFNALIDHYKLAAQQFQGQVDNEIYKLMPPEFTNANPILNYWMNGPQEVFHLVPFLEFDDEMDSSDPTAFSNHSDSYGVFLPWFSILFDVNNAQKLMKIWFLIEKEKADPANPAKARVSYTKTGSNRWTARMYLGARDAIGVAERLLDFSLELFLLNDWYPVTTTDPKTVADAFYNIWEEQLYENDLKGDVLAGWPLFTAECPTGYVDLSDCNQWEYPWVYRYNGESYYRMRIHGDSIGPILESSIVEELLRDYREAVHDALTAQLDDEASALAMAAKELDDAAALINAYLSLGMPKEMDQSQLLRSAFRGKPGFSEVGLGSSDVLALVVQMAAQDKDPSATGWADQDFNVQKISNILWERIDTIGGEIERGLARPAFAPDYVGWVLAELRHLRDTAYLLAKDDTYLIDAGGIVTVGANGLLDNDARQGSSPITIDTSFSPEDGYTPPTKGVVIINEDGSLTYTAYAGFSGTDRFTYRAKMNIDGVPKTIYSNTATVMIISEDLRSGQLIFADGFE